MKTFIYSITNSTGKLDFKEWYAELVRNLDHFEYDKRVKVTPILGKFKGQTELSIMLENVPREWVQMRCSIFGQDSFLEINSIDGRAFICEGEVMQAIGNIQTVPSYQSIDSSVDHSKNLLTGEVYLVSQNNL